jgi:DNA-binding YbaB/EbfC family protein
VTDLPAVPDDEGDDLDDVDGADDAGGLGGMGGLDLGALLEQAQEMAAGMAEAQQAAADTVVEGSSGGGMVTVTVTGTFEFQRVRIDPKAIDPGDPGMLEDLVLAAVRDAARRVGELQQQSIGGLGPLGGDLGGLLGGG